MPAAKAPSNSIERCMMVETPFGVCATPATPSRVLERCRDSQPESLAGLAEQVTRAIALQGFLVGIVTRAAGRKRSHVMSCAEQLWLGSHLLTSESDAGGDTPPVDRGTKVSGRSFLRFGSRDLRSVRVASRGLRRLLRTALPNASAGGLNRGTRVLPGRTSPHASRHKTCRQR